MGVTSVWSPGGTDCCSVSQREALKQRSPGAPESARAGHSKPLTALYRARGPSMAASLDNTLALFQRGPGGDWAMACYCPYFRGWEFLLLSLVAGFTFFSEKGGLDIFVLSLQVPWRLILSCCPQISFSGWPHVPCSGTETFWHLSDSDTGEHPWNKIKSVQYSNNTLHLYTQTSVIMLSLFYFKMESHFV